MSTSKVTTGNEAFMLEAVSAMAGTLVAKARRVFSHTHFSIALEGVLAIGIGVAVLVWPNTSLTAMVLVFAAYAVADGLLSILAGFTESDFASLVHGVVSLGVAMVTLAWRDASATILVYVIAVWVFAMAVLRMRSAVQSNRAHLLKAALVLLALPSVAGACMAVLSPSEGAKSVLMDIAIFQIVNGLVIVGLALRAGRTSRTSQRLVHD